MTVSPTPEETIEEPSSVGTWKLPSLSENEIQYILDHYDFEKLHDRIMSMCVDQPVTLPCSSSTTP
jgi:hypothetical protein